MRPIALIESDRRVRQEAGQEAWVGSFGSRCCISPPDGRAVWFYASSRLFPHTFSFSSYLSHPPTPRGYPLSRIGSPQQPLTLFISLVLFPFPTRSASSLYLQARLAYNLSVFLCLLVPLSRFSHNLTHPSRVPLEPSIRPNHDPDA
ncbi:hypothetical protein CALVIDRAFT_226229 [Calocera viscosa TUFC12733]|uniref:Uncharacterized protein n=1 Tax=Calocera viscosa (strain TUFC12733) TaxID=1330018 RepID=A0A167K1B2_CALVF|nr:hypothetical protein CALVIDRAFT_226229 [Calocera viscosa TUFC12733]